jgi:DNA-binding transcriptional ArsR family regulator
MLADRLSTTFAALADPTRRAILARLASGETSVSELAEPFDMSLPAVSKHLKVLEHAGLIARGREAQWRPPDRATRAGRSTTGWNAIAASGAGSIVWTIPARTASEGRRRMPKRKAKRRDRTGDRVLVVTRVFDARHLLFQA